MMCDSKNVKMENNGKQRTRKLSDEGQMKVR